MINKRKNLMFLKKKNRYRPLYKQLIKLRENVQRRKKLLKFKRKKWKTFIFYYKKTLKWYQKFNIYDPTRYVASQFPDRWTAYKNRYRSSHYEYKKFKIFYGKLSQKYIKKQIRSLFKNSAAKKKTVNWNLLFLEKFESRLDSVLCKAKFSTSLRNARQLILHGKVFVNNKLMRIPSYIVKETDLISIDPKYHFLIKNNLRRMDLSSLPTRYFTVNYTTFEIIMGNIKGPHLSISLPFYINLEKIIMGYHRH